MYLQIKRFMRLLGNCQSVLFSSPLNATYLLQGLSLLQKERSMKRNYILVLAIAFMIIAGCQKEFANLPSGFQGTWELVSTDGAWFGHRDFEPGNGNTFNFTGNTYLRKVKTTDTAYQYSGKFVIYKAKPCELASEQTLIKFDNDTEGSSFSLSNTTLTIGATECIADGVISTYRKIQ